MRAECEGGRPIASGTDFPPSLFTHSSQIHPYFIRAALLTISKSLYSCCELKEKPGEKIATDGQPLVARGSRIWKQLARPAHRCDNNYIPLLLLFFLSENTTSTERRQKA